MNKLQAIRIAKEFRKKLDDILQDMKAHRKEITARVNRFDDPESPEHMEDIGEVLAQHTLSTRDLESAIMRQGMALKYIGNPNPYPESKNPESPVVEPTADDLKM